MLPQERAGISASRLQPVQVFLISQSATVRRVRAMSIRDSSSAEAAIDGMGGRDASASGTAGSPVEAGVVMW